MVKKWIYFQISNQEVNRIESLFSDSFDLIQEAVRRIERTLRQMRDETLSMAIDDLDNSRWNNLREQRLALEREVTNVHARYMETKTELNDTLANLESNLTEALTGQVRKNPIQIFDLL
jgi:predicted  nucleic acid-binding Zn-ribbon protein